MTRKVRILTNGSASGPCVVLDEALSFWGGYDSSTGKIVDPAHPQFGMSLEDTVVVMVSGRGSSSSSAVLAEAIRVGTAPAAIVLERPDGIIALGSIVAYELYGRKCPVVSMDGAGGLSLSSGAVARLDASTTEGVLTITSGDIRQ